MVSMVPTHVGDVLILRTQKSFTIYAVGLILKDDQQDFDGHTDVNHATDRVGAVAARPARHPGLRVDPRTVGEVCRSSDTNR